MEVETKQGKKELKKVPEYKLKKEDVKRLINYATKVPSEAAKKVKHKMREKVIAAIVAAFGFIIALVWRDAIRAFVDEIVVRAGIEGTGHIYTLISAVFVTTICVIGILFFSRWSEAS